MTDEEVRPAVPFGRAGGDLLSMNDAPKPEFNRPPVNEVALAAQFDPLSGGAYALAQVAEMLKAVDPGYESVVERPPQPPLPPRDAPRGISLQLLDAPEPPLFWLLDESSHHLIQIQRDRLVVNWRKLTPDEPYPSFESILPRWKQAWAVLEEAVARGDLGQLTPNACELTYFNAIEPSPKIGQLVAPWSGEHSDGFLPEPTEVRLAAQYPLPDDGGYLTIELTPAIRQDTGAAASLLRVGARGWPASPDHDSVLRFFEIAHDWIVRGFTSFTTPTMHELWERTDVAN